LTLDGAEEEKKAPGILRIPGVWEDNKPEAERIVPENG
jgi:hypothetical protein